MIEQKLVSERPTNYGSMERVRLYDLTSEQLRSAGEQKQVYTSFPFFNDLINLAIGQVKAVFNQEMLAPPASQTRLKHILDNFVHRTQDNESSPLLPPMIRALTASELTDDNSRVFVSLAEAALEDLELNTMSDAVKHDFIFVLHCSLSVLEGVEKSKVMRFIKRFEATLPEEVSLSSDVRGRRMSL